MGEGGGCVGGGGGGWGLIIFSKDFKSSTFFPFGALKGGAPNSTPPPSPHPKSVTEHCHLGSVVLCFTEI